MKSKLLAGVLLILSVMLIGGFFYLTPTYIQDAGDLKHFEDADLSFDLSKNWTVYEYDDAIKTPFLSSSPSHLILTPVDNSMYSYYEGDVEDLTANGTVLNTSTTNATDVVIVQTEIAKIKSLPEGFSLDNAYQTDSIYRMMASSGKFHLVSDTALEVDGHQAHQFVYDVSYSRYQDTWIQGDGNYYRVFSYSPTTVYGEAEPIFNQTLSTLKIK